MKIQKSKPISAFGGINFVLEYLHDNKIDNLFNESLPLLSAQSKYSWSDIIQSLLSIYLCGGDCIEDLQTHLKQHFKNNPFINIPSPDTVLRRLSQLTEQNNKCRTKRGNVTHKYNSNQVLNELNVKLLNKLGSFNAGELTLDYDNTIIFNEKYDSKMTYKRQYGYQPGICTINEDQILYIENRNGNSDAKAFQKETLVRLFELLNKNNIKKVDHFRADAASYQFDVVRLLEKNVKNFFIGCRNSYVSKFFNQVTNWVKISDINGEIMEVGDVIITPFQQQCKKAKIAPKEYRLIVKRKPKPNSQIDIFTNDANEYRAILTNNLDLSTVDAANFYNHRGNMEKQFDIMKNDFGWNQMPFSTLEKNTVFLYFTAMCRSLYSKIISFFSKRVKILRPTDRVKKFLFRFIIIPAKWIKKARQHQLRIYGDIHFST